MPQLIVLSTACTQRMAAAVYSIWVPTCVGYKPRAAVLLTQLKEHSCVYALIVIYGLCTDRHIE